jgi:hypothetical protein
VDVTHPSLSLPFEETPPPPAIALDRPTVALSLTQPFAWLIEKGFKPFENRRWELWRPLKGKRFYIHAAKGMTKDDYEDAKRFAGDRGVQVPAISDLAYGGIVGSVRAVRCFCPDLYGTVPASTASKIWGLDPPVTEDEMRWWMEGQHGFLVRDPVSLPFTPCKGALGFWKIDDALREQLG